MSFTSLVFSGAIFGFFYAWICSTIWGLDTLDPRRAIEAMVAMNISVRNVVFAPAFFGTPFVLLGTAALAWSRTRRGALCFGLGGLLYLGGGMILTMAVNVPMNEALAATTIPEDRASAELFWRAYIDRWEVYNIARTLVSGATLVLAGMGVWAVAKTT